MRPAGFNGGRPLLKQNRSLRLWGRCISGSVDLLPDHKPPWTPWCVRVRVRAPEGAITYTFPPTCVCNCACVGKNHAWKRKTHRKSWSVLTALGCVIITAACQDARRARGGAGRGGGGWGFYRFYTSPFTGDVVWGIKYSNFKFKLTFKLFHRTGLMIKLV